MGSGITPCSRPPDSRSTNQTYRAENPNGPVRQQNPRQIPKLTITAAPPASGMAALANPTPSASPGSIPAAPTALGRFWRGILNDPLKSDLSDLILTSIDPYRHALRGNQISAGGSLCSGPCIVAFNLAAGFVLTPAGPNDWFFGEADVFVTVGGSLMGASLGPEDSNLLPSIFPVILPYLYPSVGASAAAGVEYDAFVSNEVVTIEGFRAWSRNLVFGAGPFSVSESENSSGKVYGFGFGISKGGGGNVYNSYTKPWRVW
jgi:hypothetical protein